MNEMQGEMYETLSETSTSKLSVQFPTVSTYAKKIYKPKFYYSCLSRLCTLPGYANLSNFIYLSGIQSRKNL